MKINNISYCPNINFIWRPFEPVIDAAHSFCFNWLQRRRITVARLRKQVPKNNCPLHQLHSHCSRFHICLAQPLLTSFIVFVVFSLVAFSTDHFENRSLFLIFHLLKWPRKQSLVTVFHLTNFLHSLMPVCTTSSLLTGEATLLCTAFSFSATKLILVSSSYYTPSNHALPSSSIHRQSMYYLSSDPYLIPCALLEAVIPISHSMCKYSIWLNLDQFTGFASNALYSTLNRQIFSLSAVQNHP